jgi:hypothetical protein
MPQYSLGVGLLFVLLVVRIAEVDDCYSLIQALTRLVQVCN